MKNNANAPKIIRLINGPANAIIDPCSGVAPALIETYAGTKNINPGIINLSMNAKINHPYAALKLAVSPNDIATNLCPNSWRIIAGAIIIIDVRNACLLNHFCVNAVTQGFLPGVLILKKSIKINPIIAVIKIMSIISEPLSKTILIVYYFINKSVKFLPVI